MNLISEQVSTEASSLSIILKTNPLENKVQSDIKLTPSQRADLVIKKLNLAFLKTN